MRVVFIKDYVDEEEVVFVEAGDTGELLDEARCLIQLDNGGEILELVNQGCFVFAEDVSELENLKQGEFSDELLEGEDSTGPFGENDFVF